MNTARSKSRSSVMLASDEEGLRRYLHTRGEFTPEWQESAFIGGWGVYATREDVDELSSFVVEWLRERGLGFTTPAAKVPMVPEVWKQNG